MAALEHPDLSLMSLEEDLTCSICLSPFDCPVSLPCGHNFCQGCLLASWTETYICPQCRTNYPTKPELRKNTVLSTVVETFNLRSSRSEQDLSVDVEEVEEVVEEVAEEVTVICCDSCMEAEAAQTCLTCMASFCDEHLRPHLENPVFRPHQLIDPVADLQERICPDHHKLMEFFCSQHALPICSLCLQQVHRGCTFISPEEQRRLKESDLREKLNLLHSKIVQNKSVLSKMGAMESKLEVLAANRKKALANIYQQMHEILKQEENMAVNTMDKEVESGQSKLKLLMRKFSENVENMSKAKEDITALLSRSLTLAFLKESFKMPAAVTFNPYTPRISLDSNAVLANEKFAMTLSERLTEMCKQPLEARQAASAPANPPCSFGTYKDPGLSGISGPLDFFMCSGPAPGSQPKGAAKKTKHVKKPKPTAVAKGNKSFARSTENLSECGKNKGCPSSPDSQRKAENTSLIPPDVSCGEKRGDLLKYARTLTLDRKTAHKRIILGEECTKASVSDEQANYPNNPERFAVCSQVLASKGFSSGRHYWEMRLSCNNFIGVGLAYGSIDRKGPASRLGRNAQSWCVEWFNVKLSAWHNSMETILANPSPKRVGVLLDCDGGMVTFYNVMDRAYPFHSIVFPFTEAVYPAFWMFSSGSSLTLCKLQV